MAATWPSSRDLTVTDAFASARPDALRTTGRSRRSAVATVTRTAAPPAPVTSCGTGVERRAYQSVPATSTMRPAAIVHFARGEAAIDKERGPVIEVATGAFCQVQGSCRRIRCRTTSSITPSWPCWRRPLWAGIRRPTSRIRRGRSPVAFSLTRCCRRAGIREQGLALTGVPGGSTSGSDRRAHAIKRGQPRSACGRKLPFDCAPRMPARRVAGPRRHPRRSPVRDEHHGRVRAQAPQSSSGRRLAARLRAWRVAAVSIWTGGSRRIALRGTKASSAAVSFARSVKESRTANLGHGNGPLGCLPRELSPDVRTFALPCDDVRDLTDGLSGPLRLRPHLEPSLGIDGERAREEPIDVVGQDPVVGIVRPRKAFDDPVPCLGRNGSVLVEPFARLRRSRGCPQPPLLRRLDAPDRLVVAHLAARALPRRFGVDAPAAQLL